MYRPDQYLGFIVAILFLGGIILAFFTLRQRSRKRRQWQGTRRDALGRVRR